MEATPDVSTPKRSQRTLVGIGVCVGILISGVLIGLFAIVWFTLIEPAKQAEKVRRAQSAQNLIQIGGDLQRYESSPKYNAYPPDLKDVELDDPRLLLNPRFPEQKLGYIYIPGSTSADEANIVVYENVPAGQEASGRNVLTADGNVHWQSDEEFKQELKKTQDALHATKTKTR
jgi:hypothetical protein